MKIIKIIVDEFPENCQRCSLGIENETFFRTDCLPLKRTGKNSSDVRWGDCPLKLNKADVIKSVCPEKPFKTGGYCPTCLKDKRYCECL